MLLKEVLENIKKNDYDVIWIWSKNPRCREKSYISHIERKKYFDCDVVSFEVKETKFIEPISCKTGYCKQYSIEIDWDEVRIIREKVKK